MNRRYRRYLTRKGVRMCEVLDKLISQGEGYTEDAALEKILK